MRTNGSGNCDARLQRVESRISRRAQRVTAQDLKSIFGGSCADLCSRPYHGSLCNGDCLVWYLQRLNQRAEKRSCPLSPLQNVSRKESQMPRQGVKFKFGASGNSNGSTPASITWSCALSRWTIIEDGQCSSSKMLIWSSLYLGSGPEGPLFSSLAIKPSGPRLQQLDHLNIQTHEFGHSSHQTGFPPVTFILP